jgi:hypothetical protein
MMHAWLRYALQQRHPNAARQSIEAVGLRGWTRHSRHKAAAAFRLHADASRRIRCDQLQIGHAGHALSFHRLPRHPFSASINAKDYGNP